MITQSFDHERFDVYRLSLDHVAGSFEEVQPLKGLHRHARDQWLRAAQSIPLNIAEATVNVTSKIVLDFRISLAVQLWSVPQFRMFR